MIKDFKDLEEHFEDSNKKPNAPSGDDLKKSKVKPSPKVKIVDPLSDELKQSKIQPSPKVKIVDPFQYKLTQSKLKSLFAPTLTYDLIEERSLNSKALEEKYIKQLQDGIDAYSSPAGHSTSNVVIVPYVVAEGTSFDSRYQAILDQATLLGYSLPSPNQQIAQNELLVSMSDAGVWDKLDIYYNFVTDGSQEFATINWKDPSLFQISLVNSPTFTPNYGFTAVSTSQLRTGWIPVTDGVNWDSPIAGWMLVNNVVVGSNTINSPTQNSYQIASSISHRFAVNGPISGILATTNTIGFKTFSRFNGTSTGYRVTHNGVFEIANGAGGAVTEGATDVRFFSLEGQSVGSYGAGTNFVSPEESDWYNAWQTYKINGGINNPYVQAWLDKGTSLGYTLPDQTTTNALNTLFDSLSSQLTYFDVLKIYGFNDVNLQEISTLNFINPNLYSSSLINSPTYQTNGFKGNGSTMYINHNFAPSNGAQMTPENYGGFVRIKESTIRNSERHVGSRIGGNSYSYTIGNWNASQVLISSYGQVLAITDTNHGATGSWWVGNDTASVYLWRNGNFDASGSQSAASGSNTSNIYELAWNSAGGASNHSANTVSSAVGFGSWADINRATVDAAFEVYDTTLGI